MLEASFLVQSGDFQSAGSQSWHMTCEDEINNCIFVKFFKIIRLENKFVSQNRGVFGVWVKLLHRLWLYRGDLSRSRCHPFPALKRNHEVANMKVIARWEWLWHRTQTEISKKQGRPPTARVKWKSSAVAVEVNVNWQWGERKVLPITCHEGPEGE